MITHKSPISGIATYGNKYVATSGYDSTVILWDAASGEPIARGRHDHLANSCRFTTDGKYLATSSSDYSARIWEVPSMKLVTIINGHTDDVDMVAFHSNGKILATVSHDKTLRIFDFEGNQLNIMDGSPGTFASAEWIGDTDKLVSTSNDGTVKIWNGVTGDLLSDFSFDDIETDTLIVDKRGKIFAGNDEGQVILIEEGKEPKVFPGHKAGIKRLVYSSEVDLMVSLSYDGKFKVWDFDGDSISEIAEHAFDPMVWPRSCAFLNNEELVFGTFGQKYAQFNIKTGKWKEDVLPTYGINSVKEIQNKCYWVGDSGFVYEDGVKIAEMGSLCNFIHELEGVIICGGQTGEIFNARTGEVFYQHTSPLNTASNFMWKNKPAVIVASYTGEGIILVPDGEGKLKFAQTVKIHENAIKGISSDSKSIFAVCASGAVAYNSVDTLECVNMERQGHYAIANACVKVDEGVFASVSRDLHLRIWTDGAKEVFRTKHQNSIRSLAVDRGGRFLALGDYVGWVSIFDRETKDFIRHTRISDFGVSSICYSESQDTFIASSYDGNLYTVKMLAQ